VVRSLAAGLACTLERVECGPAVTAWPLIMVRRVTPLDSLTNSGRGKTPEREPVPWPLRCLQGRFG